MIRNLTMFQINLEIFGTLSDLRHQVSQTWPCSNVNLGYGQIWGIKCFKHDCDPNLSRRIWNMVRFWTYDTKPDYVPNPIMSQIYLSNFGIWSGLVPCVPNQTVSQIYLDEFGLWSGLEHQVFKPDHVPGPTWDIPSWIWDIVSFQTWYPKSIWEVRNQNSDLGMSQIRFGTKLRLVYNSTMKIYQMGKGFKELRNVLKIIIGFH